MNAMAVAQRMTADEYLTGPEDSRRTELVAGEVIVHEPRKPHQFVVMELLHALQLWLRAQDGRGQVWIPLDVKLDDSNVFAPDLLWYRAGRDEDPDPPYALPDLAVEVRSPSTWRYDIGAKKSAYERGGLPELWLVDTAADVVLVFRRSSATSAMFDVSLELMVDDDLTSPLLPGFAHPVRALFAA
jgi:Uma2 family endonuclease